MLLAFPKVVAAGFSGLMLPIFFLVWALMVRGLGIELRGHGPGPLWRAFFDVLFQASSVLVPVLAGAALATVVRGVPLDAEGFFELALFPADHQPGLLGGYTVLCGAFVLAALTTHGAVYLRWKTRGPVQTRAAALVLPLGLVTMTLWALAAAASALVAPAVLGDAVGSPGAWVGLALSVGGAVGVAWASRRGRHLASFVASSAFVAGQLLTVVGSLHPVLLRSTLNPAWSLTLDNAAAGSVGLAAGLWWWPPGLLLAVGYFTWVMRQARLWRHG